MRALILAGGLGTRLRPLTFSIPKPLLPVGERPLLQVIIEQLRSFGIVDVLIATGYQSEVIRAFGGDGSRFGVSIDYVHEEQPLGTAGPLSLVKDELGADETILMMNGDILTRLDFGRFMSTSVERGHDLTTCHTTYTYESPFGVLSVEDDLVVGIVEKPSVEYRISAGIYAVNRRAIDFVPDGAFFTMPELVSALLAAGRPVGAYPVDDFWLGLETVAAFDRAIAELRALSEEIAEGQ
jgi:NDP-sugar pyrophosphorylase family protein